MIPRNFVFFFLLCAAPVWAQAVPAAGYFSATELRDSVAAAPQAQDGTAARVLGGPAHYKYIVIRRDQSGEVEIHDLWDDVVIVQEGSGTVLYGGQLTGERLARRGDRGGGPGERRGGVITGGTTQTLAAGDLMVVPAGVPHQVRVEPGRSITYLLIKVAPGADNGSNR